MDSLKRLFINKLKIALETPCPEKIPRTGDKAKDVDCYAVYVTDKNGTYLATSVEGNKLKADLWDAEKQKHSIAKTLYLDNLDELNFEINHFHGVVTHTYKSWMEFTIHEATLIYKLLSYWAIAKSTFWVVFFYRLPQLVFNRKRIGKPNREQVLIEVIELNRRNRHQDFEASKLLQNRYGTRVARHPDYPALLNDWFLILESLAEEGEVSGGPNKYRIKGKAITSLQALQEENARKNRSDNNAKWMTILTLILAFTTLFQSGLVVTEYQINLDELWALLKESIEFELLARGVALSR